MQKSRRLAGQDCKMAHQNYKANHDKEAKKHNIKVGDQVLVDTQMFVSKNKKFSPVWIGPL